MTGGSVKRDGTRWMFVVDVPGPAGRRKQVRRRGFATKKEAQDDSRAYVANSSAGPSWGFRTMPVNPGPGGGFVPVICEGEVVQHLEHSSRASEHLLRARRSLAVCTPGTSIKIT